MIPANASEPSANSSVVAGILRHSPPSDSTTCCSVAWMTEPAPRNSSDLKKACVNRWNIAAVTDPTPSATNMNPSCDTVEYASTRLMSLVTRPSVAPSTAVVRPMYSTTSRATSATSNTGIMRATRYTPATTMVAAWMSALTGVGPSIASGSQTWNGNCADLPAAPAKTMSIETVR